MPSRPRFERGPSGAMVLRSLLSELERGHPAGLTVLTGEDLFHLDRAQSALLARLVPEDASDFALGVFGESKIASEELVAAARSHPMFAERRVVLLRDVSLLEGDEAPLLAYARNPPAYSYLVVRAPKLDLRRALHKTLASAGTLLEFRPLGSDVELAREIEALARERQLRLEREVPPLLIEVTAQDLYRVASELDKISAWLAGSGVRVVSLQCAREVVSSGGLLTGWEVADAVVERRADAAVEAVRKLVDAGEEPIRILGGLSFRARALLQAKAMAESGATLQEILGSVRAGGSPRTLESSLARYTLAELSEFPARLLRADLALKSRSLDARMILESLVVALTARAASGAPRGVA